MVVSTDQHDTKHWCEECGKLVDPEDLKEDGSCPRCGHLLVEPSLARRKIPWSFRFMIVATIVYLGWRAYQGVAWLVHHV